MAVDRIECDDRTVGTVDHRPLLTGGEVENVVGELETTGPDPVFLSVDIGELLEGDEVPAPERSGRSGAVLEEGGRAVPPGRVADEADVRAEHDGASAIGGVVAGTLVVVVSAFGTPAGEVHEETIASAIRAVAGVPNQRCRIRAIVAEGSGRTRSARRFVTRPRIRLRCARGGT